MSFDFFEKPILNSPYEYPARHWELDEHGQPTHRILDYRRPSQHITPTHQGRNRPCLNRRGTLVPQLVNRLHQRGMQGKRVKIYCHQIPSKTREGHWFLVIKVRRSVQISASA
jgi:hypothetical protein